MAKSPEAFRTISEVAEWLDTPAHVLRFWESRFSQIKPVKRAGGRRYYRPGDMLLLGGLKKLLHEDGMTIKGAQKLLKEKGIKHVAALSQPLETQLKDLPPIRDVVIEAKAETETIPQQPSAAATTSSPSEPAPAASDAKPESHIPSEGLADDTADRAVSEADTGSDAPAPDTEKTETKSASEQAASEPEEQPAPATEPEVEPDVEPEAEPPVTTGPEQDGFFTRHRPTPETAETVPASEAPGTAPHDRPRQPVAADSPPLGADPAPAEPPAARPVPRIVEVTVTPADQLPEPEVAVVLKQLRSIRGDTPGIPSDRLIAIYRRLEILRGTMDGKENGPHLG